MSSLEELHIPSLEHPFLLYHIAINNTRDGRVLALDIWRNESAVSRYYIETRSLSLSLHPLLFYTVSQPFYLLDVRFEGKREGRERRRRRKKNLVCVPLADAVSVTLLN